MLIQRHPPPLCPYLASVCKGMQGAFCEIKLVCYCMCAPGPPPACRCVPARESQGQPHREQEGSCPGGPALAAQQSSGRPGAFTLACTPESQCAQWRPAGGAQGCPGWPSMHMQRQRSPQVAQHLLASCVPKAHPLHHLARALQGHSASVGALCARVGQQREANSPARVLCSKQQEGAGEGKGGRSGAH